jgi:hypothetical protein
MVPRMDFVLIPGMWLPGSVWDPVTAHLTSLGHRATALTLPGHRDPGRRREPPGRPAVTIAIPRSTRTQGTRA